MTSLRKPGTSNSGDPADGADLLIINGTANADTFLLRAQFVAAMQPSTQPGAGPNDFAPTFERINYDSSINVLHVNGLDGDDRFYVDDNSAISVLDGGAGNDINRQLAQPCQFERLKEKVDRTEFLRNRRHRQVRPPAVIEVLILIGGELEALRDCHRRT